MSDTTCTARVSVVTDVTDRRRYFVWVRGFGFETCFLAVVDDFGNLTNVESLPC